MIYGIYFNGTQIPDGIKRRFAARVRMTEAWVEGRKYWLYLAGVATTPEDRDNMLIQANNGRRELHVVARKTAGGDFYGIYTS